MNMLPVGTEVYYNGTYGIVQFICDEYITVCIQSGADSLRDVCILVYPSQQHKLELVNGNHSHEL